MPTFSNLTVALASMPLPESAMISPRPKRECSMCWPTERVPAAVSTDETEDCAEAVTVERACTNEERPGIGLRLPRGESVERVVDSVAFQGSRRKADRSSSQLDERPAKDRLRVPEFDDSSTETY